ncbi:MAG: ABC transporter permease [Spirochaetales bacterium]|nr:ABC transporter permease [Spirochaetales bacterium]
MIGVLIKTMFRRVKNEPLLLILTLVLAPFFVVLYKLIFLEGMTVYNVVILETENKALKYQKAFIEEMEEAQYPGGSSLFHFKWVADESTGEQLLQNHDAHCMLRFLSDSHPPEIEIIGDYSNPYFVVCSQIIQNNLKEHYLSRLRLPIPVKITEIPVGNSGEKTEFETYIPGLVIFSALVLMYLFAILLIKEVENNVFYRYRLSGLGWKSFISAYSIIFLLITALSSLLTLGTSFLLGFHSAVSVYHDICFSAGVCTILAFSTIGIAFFVAGVADNMSKGFLITTFPFMLMVFFSGSVYPFPKIILFNAAGRGIGLFDFLSSTHAVIALGKILTFGVKPGALLFELLSMFLLSILVFAVGIIVFIHRRWHLK